MTMAPDTVHDAVPEAAPEDDPLQQAADAVADGVAVDWTGIATRLTSKPDPQRLENLRLIAAIKALDPGSDEDAEATSLRASPRTAAPKTLPSRQPLSHSSGKAWGRYRLLEEVGAGSFGKVFRAWDPNLEREIAVK